MKAVFDLDDTICRTINRDYENSSVIEAVRQKITELRKVVPGCRIIIHTARGMGSNNGNRDKAEAKNRPIIEAWLKRHGIEVDEIVFGKPFADLYVDDKAMTASDFATAAIRRYSGLSGATVYRIGSTCIKEARNALQQADWYDKAESLPHPLYRLPRIDSVSPGELFMEFVPGTQAFRCMGTGLIDKLVRIIRTQPQLPGENDLKAYAEYVEKRADDAGLFTDGHGEELTHCGLLRKRTFCHGDFSTQNILVTSGNDIVLIDPSPKDCISTWVLDAAKLRASLRWLDASLVGTKYKPGLIRHFDNHFTDEEVEAIRLVEKSHFYRVYYYAKKLGRKEVAEALWQNFHQAELQS